LEFLGDAVLGLLVGESLYRRFPDLSEGPLTQLRAALVQRETLARWAEVWELGDMLLMGRGEERSGGRQRPRNLAGVLEAVIGALYLDQGLGATRNVVEQRVEQALSDRAWKEMIGDPKSFLQERLQAIRHESPRYRLLSEEGPPHARRYVVQVSAVDEPLGEGEGSSKRRAEDDAARDALRRLEGLLG
jgi:ribonuclease-3